MFKYYNALLNRSGDALAGYYVRLFDSAGNQVTIYADENETAISTESGVANAAKSDLDGMVRFFVPSGDYDIRLYDPNDNFISTERAVPMVKGISELALEGDDGATKVGTSESVTVQAALDARAKTADLASTDSDKGAAMVGTDDGGDVQTALDNRMPVINAAKYGFDRAGVLAAIAAVPEDGGTVFCPAGDYLIGSLLSFARSNITIQGEPGTRFVVDGAAVVCIRPGGTEEDRISNIIIRGITFYDPAPEEHADGPDQSHGIGAVYVDGLTIEDCTFIDIGDESVEVNRCTAATVRNNWFFGAASSSSGGGGVTVSSSSGVLVDGNHIIDTQLGQGVRVEIAEADWDVTDIRITNNYFKGQQALQAISISPGLANIEGVVITGNQFDECATEAISFTPSSGRYVRDVTISGNTVRGGGDLSATGAGAVRGAIFANGDRVQRLTITGNAIYDWGASGTDSAGHHGIAAWNAVIAGNHVEGCFDSGIVGQGESLIIGNRCIGNGLTATGGGRAGIQYGTDAIVRGNLVKGNYRGIHTRSSVTGGVIEGNKVIGNTIGIALNGANYSRGNWVTGNTTGVSMSGTGAYTDDILIGNTTAITDSGTNSIKRGRAPSEFITKNNGAATIPSGSTFIAVTHGLSNQTPGAKDISVTPTNNLGSASKFWVSNISATQFRINVDVDPGADATFAWQAEIQ